VDRHGNPTFPERVEVAVRWAGGAKARPTGMRDSTSRDTIRDKEPESCFKVVVAWEFLSFFESLRKIICWGNGWAKGGHNKQGKGRVAVVAQFCLKDGELSIKRFDR
jgi:hypothetical protein